MTLIRLERKKPRFRKVLITDASGVTTEHLEPTFDPNWPARILEKVKPPRSIVWLGREDPTHEWMVLDDGGGYDS